jgi:hypothetical protein
MYAIRKGDYTYLLPSDTEIMYEQVHYVITLTTTEVR